MKLKLKITAVLLTTILSSCAIGPDYQRPPTSLPAQYSAHSTVEPTQTSPAVVDQWWIVFNDSTLNTLVTQALAKNADLRIAVARVDEAIGVLKETGAVLYPQIDLGASSTRSKSSTLGSIPVPSTAVISNSNRLALSTSFEIDVWGKLRRASQAAQAQYLASRYSRDTVALALAGTTAQSYFALRALDAQITVTQASVKSRAESLILAQNRLKAGYASELDLNQAQAALAAARATLSDLTRQRGLVQNQLGNFTGEPGLSIMAGDVRNLPLPATPPPGLPSVLLERRPDVQQAEQSLIAANALVGVAKAAMLPSLSLSSAFGGQSAELSDLLKTGARIWSLGFGLALPLFDAGKFSARTEQAQARQQQAVASYQKAAESAFREVADALIAAEQLQSQEAALQTQVDAAQNAMHLSSKRYQAGYSAYLEVLDAQRSANDAQLGLIRVRQARLNASVDLMKALGGGWTSEASIDPAGTNLHSAYWPQESKK